MSNISEPTYDFLKDPLIKVFLNKLKEVKAGSDDRFVYNYKHRNDRDLWSYDDRVKSRARRLRSIGELFYGEKDCDGLDVLCSEILEQAFYWEFTGEGHDYWRELCNTLQGR